MKTRKLASIFYLLYYGAAGALIPFLNLFYRDVGMSTRQIGVLAALPTVTVLVASPIWSGLADAFRLHKQLLPLVTVGTLLPISGLMLSRSFSGMAVLILAYAIFNAPIIPLGDNAALELLGENVDQYGKLRIWGAVGFGITAWGSGIIAENVGLWSAFAAYLVLMVLTAWSTFHLPAPKMLATEPFFLNIRNLSTNPRWIGFLLAVFMASTCYSILNNFLVIYLDDLGAGEALYGLSIAAAGISEIPVYIFSTQLLRIVKPHRMLVIAFVALAVRGFVYALIHDPRWAVGAQLLHGPTFSTMWIAGVIYAKSTAPSGLGASAQSALGVMLFGFGAGAGALLGAWLYDGFGPQVAFHSAAGFALVGLTVFGLSEMRASSKANTAN